MNAQELTLLAKQGNTFRVEQEWLALLESADVSVERLIPYRDALVELSRGGATDLAATLAWTAIDALAQNTEPVDTVSVAGPFLVAVGDHDELRGQVAELYTSAYGDREGFEALMAEAGLRAGRPVRRAVRTLDVCLALSDGDFLASRDDDEVACVEKVDKSNWTFRISTGEDTEKLGAVALADRFQPVPATDFRVLRCFDRELLQQRLNEDPAALVIELCQRFGNKIDGDQLEQLLVPDPLSESEWKKWFTRARGELKKCSNVQVEARAPFTITLLARGATHEESLVRDFDKRQHEPAVQYSLVEQYVRDCRSRKTSPDPHALRHCYESFAVRGHHAARGDTRQATYLLMARRVGEWAGVPEAADGIVNLFKAGGDVESIVGSVEDAGLRQLALESLRDARPNDWRAQFIAMLPCQPLVVCDWMAQELIKAGVAPSELAAVAQVVLAEPGQHFEAVLWLWDGPSDADILSGVTLLTIFIRVLRGLDEFRRKEVGGRELEKVFGPRARSVLSARGFARFKAMLKTLEPGMAAALKRQINPLDSLGRAVREDLLNLIQDEFPVADIKPKKAAWAREDVLYVTEEGMRRKQAEIDHHVNVVMRENAKAIGAAAEKGDLSENSEYKFALEERDLLQARLLQMNNEMNMAQVIQPDDVPTNGVGVGTRVVFRKVDDGSTYELSFLGPWDADMSRGTINYKSPLAQGLMGKRVGEMVEFEHSGAKGTYTIVELRNALRDEVGVR